MKSRAASIIVEDGRVLLIHRIKGEREYYVLPGGSVEKGESREQACRRETKEETGLDIRIVGRFLTFTNAGREEAYFLAERTGGELELGEPERSRRSPSNRYALEWVDGVAFGTINFQPKQLRQSLAEHLAAGHA